MVVTKTTLAVLLGAMILADLLILSAQAARNFDLLLIGTGMLRWPFGLAIYALPLAFVGDLVRWIALGRKRS